MIEKIGGVAYKLLLPPSARIHPIFHCSQLKLCKGDHAQPYVPLPITNSEMQPVLQPEMVLQSRVILRNHQQVQQQLIKWEGLEDDEATCEDTSAIKLVFPNFNLEDKVSFKGEGNVTSAAVMENEEGKGGTKARRHMENEEGERRSMRARITNSGLTDFVWSQK